MRPGYILLLHTLVAFLLSHSTSFAQKGQQRTTVVSGIIQNAETKEKLPFVDIYLNKVIDHGKLKTKKDTAALNLLEKITQNKTLNQPKQPQQYSFEEYSKTEFDLYNISDKFKKRKLFRPFNFVFENTDSTKAGIEYLPILLKESISDVYLSENPTLHKKIVKASRFSGVENPSISKLVNISFAEVDVYAETISLGEGRVASPFANNATNHYKYQLTDSAFFHNSWCYKLEFSGRKKQDLAFKGHAWVENKTFAIKNVDIHILKNKQYKINEFGVRQSFTKLDNGTWFKSQENTYMKILSKSEESQSVMIRKTTTRENIDYETNIPPSTFNGAPKEVLGTAGSKDLGYWAKARHYDLSDKEKSIYANIDSIKNTRAYKRLSWFSYLGSTGYLYAGPLEFGPFYKFYSFNGIEGNRIRFGGNTNQGFSKRIQLAGYLAYGFEDKEYKYEASSRIHLKRKNNLWHMLSAYYRYDLSQLDQRNPLLTHDNLALSLLRFKELSRLLMVKRANLSYEKEWENGLSTNLNLTRQVFLSIPDNDFAFKKEIREIGVITDTISIPEFTTFEMGGELVWGIGLKFLETNFYRYPFNYRKPVITTGYTIGIDGVLSAQYSYHKLHFHLRHNLKHLLGSTKYQVFAGKIFGDAPYPILNMHKGNETILFRKTAFNLMSEFEYVHDEYLTIWLEHHLDGLISNQIPLLKKLQLHGLFHARGLVGRLSEKTRDFILLPEGVGGLNMPYRYIEDSSATKKGEPYYLELGFGIENIFKMIRLDFTWRMTQRDKLEAQKWGVRIVIQPQI